MVSENSDIKGQPLHSSGGETKRTLEAKPSQRGLSNTMIFILFSALIFIGTVFVIVLAIAPTLLPLPIFAAGLVVFSTGVLTLGFVLLQRAEKPAKSFVKNLQTELPIAQMAAEISELNAQNRRINRSYHEALHRAETATASKTAFLAHLSHDIRTPLNHIIGFADLVCHEAFGPLGDQRYLAYVRDIKRSGEGLLNSVADVLELAELESGQRVLSNEEILVDELLISQKTRFDARANRCSVTLEVDCFCAAVIHGDRMGYERILSSLLDNAFRFTPIGGKIRLAAWVAQDGIVLEVTDTGIGIHPDRLEQLLQPFSHAGAEQTKNHGGLGLGLAIARSVAQLSGGDLVIDSTPSIGTTVAVSLPMNAHRDLEQDNSTSKAA